MTAASASCREGGCQVIIKCCSGNRSAGQRSRGGERAMGPGGRGGEGARSPWLPQMQVRPLCRRKEEKKHDW